MDGRTVEAKRAFSREEQHTSTRSGNPSAGRTTGGAVGGGNIRTKNIIVGGLPPTLSEDGFRQYFETCGKVTDAAVMYDESTQRPRGFGFITFDTEEAVDLVLHKAFHEVYGKMEGAKVHWFSILNSLMVIAFLAGIVLVLFLRTVRRDLTRYEELDKEAQAQMNEELAGWKLVVGDVFRAPSKAPLLCIMVGDGV